MHGTLDDRRKLAGAKAAATRRARAAALLNAMPPAGEDPRAYALAVFDREATATTPNWQCAAIALRAALAAQTVPAAPPSRRRCKTAPTAIPAASADGFAPWADYQIARRYKTDRVGPTCVVAFGDGEVARMTTACPPGKPINAGRGLRLCVRAWEQRKRRPFTLAAAEAIGRMRGAGIMNRERLDALVENRVWRAPQPKGRPVVTAMRFEVDGETVATFNPADANAALQEIEL